jgi:hypothetical protein
MKSEAIFKSFIKEYSEHIGLKPKNEIAEKTRFKFGGSI